MRNITINREINHGNGHNFAQRRQKERQEGWNQTNQAEWDAPEAEKREVMTEEITDEELSDRHQAFVDEYCISRNATEAYQKVYDCSYEVANTRGSILKNKPEIAVAILEAMEASSERCHIDQDWVLTNLKEGVERCMQHTPVLDKEGKETGEYTFQAGPMFKGIELAGKNLGMFKDTVVSTGPGGGPIQNEIIQTIVDPKETEE